MAGRTCRFAALATVLTLALGTGNAAAAELTTPAGPMTTPDLPALPALPVAPAVAPAPASAPPPQAAPAAPAAPSVQHPATARRTARNGSLTRSRTATPPRDAPSKVRGTTSATRTAGGDEARPRDRSRRAERAPLAGSRSPGRWTGEPSGFARLGEALDPGAQTPLSTAFPSGIGTSGLGWAVPLMAIMLPIGIFGFLRTARRS
jgi:hypothetical protein